MSKESKYFQPLATQIAQGESVRSAAASIGMGESTAYRLAKTQEFKTRVNELRSEFVTEAVGRLSNACSDAVEVIIDLMKNSEDDRIKLRAATTVLERFEKLADHHELRERLEALEAIHSEQ